MHRPNVLGQTIGGLVADGVSAFAEERMMRQAAKEAAFEANIVPASLSDGPKGALSPEEIREIKQELAHLTKKDRQALAPHLSRKVSDLQLHKLLHEYLYKLERLPGQVTPAELKALGASEANAEKYAKPLTNAMARHGIISVEQRAAFLGQVYAETGRLGRLTENLNYSAERLVETWPNRFKNEAAAKPYANNPEALGERVYGGRKDLKNTEPGDGFLFRGRGFLQVTGRGNYTARGYADRPQDLADPVIGAFASAAWWEDRGLVAKTATRLNENAYYKVSKLVNNPYGVPHNHVGRWNFYNRALAVLEPR